ncbi:MAG: hypothetical protein ABII68_08070, partial [Pseudomonadota bacterium]
GSATPTRIISRTLVSFAFSEYIRLLNSIEGESDGEDPQKASLCRLPPLVLAPGEGKAAGKNLRQPAMSKRVAPTAMSEMEL